jgi:hypothetical protein
MLASRASLDQTSELEPRPFSKIDGEGRVHVLLGQATALILIRGSVREERSVDDVGESSFEGASDSAGEFWSGGEVEVEA